MGSLRGCTSKRHERLLCLRAEVVARPGDVGAALAAWLCAGTFRLAVLQALLDAAALRGQFPRAPGGVGVHSLRPAKPNRAAGAASQKQPWLDSWLERSWRGLF